MPVEKIKRKPLLGYRMDLSRIQSIQLPIDTTSKGYISVEVTINVDEIPAIKTKRYLYSSLETETVIEILTEVFYFDADTYEPYLIWTCKEKLDK